MIEIIKEVGRVQLLLKGESVDKDMFFVLSGGREHIGAVAMGIYNKESGRASSSVISAPGHREDEIALKGARKVSSVTQSTTVFMVGIHVDDITVDEIQAIVKASEKMIDDVIEVIR
ncbi:MAG: hypothetical protein ACC612_01015 [Methanomethylovorans sp.]|uniref:prenylated flavin chaperone LpdD n=1 Tax=Methanomethylovorans sp. TaxID=2758717 RepID=UPI003530CEDB